MKKIKVVSLGPTSSQHIQKWIGPFEEEIDSTVITLHPGGARFTASEVISLRKYTGTKLDFLLNLFTVWRLLAKQKPDIVHFHFLSSYGLFALIPGRFSRILSAWGSDVNLSLKKNLIVKSVIKAALARFDCINSPALHIKDKLVSLGANRELIETFQYGVTIPTELVKSSPQMRHPIRFVSTRNWQDLYCIDKLVEGFCRFVENSKVDAVLYLYGGGGASDRERILTILSNYDASVTDKVVVKGYCEYNVLLKDLSTMDIFVSIPTRDGTPLSLLEAMGVGLYPIVSDIDANRECLDDQTATFIEGWEPSQIEVAIARSIERFSLSNSWLEVNKRIISGKYSYDKNTARMKSLYERFS
ncbi:glycosyltransferase [Ferrimonas pelagia]|uniref:Glycosyltransferase n=1 Tax=Ferrimonas pelagia TaxID=1177826 RepID=A0ABP9EEX6_9GAMM